MTNYSKFAGAHALARRNGYKSSYDAYIKLQWQAYRSICARCEIKGMTFEQWKAAEA